jgi:hypothetical protein
MTPFKDPVMVLNEIKQEEPPMPVLNEVKQEGTPKQTTNEEESTMQEKTTEIEEQDTDITDQEDKEMQPQEEQPEDKEELKPAPVTDKDARPPKYALRKLVRKKITTKTGKVSTIAKMCNLDTFEGSPPTEEDIQMLYVPLHGGGKYLVVDVYSKKLVERYNFPGEKIEDEEGNVIEEPTLIPAAPTARAQAAAPQPSQEPVYQEQQVQSPRAKVNVIDRMQMALGAGQTAAVDKLSELADYFAQTGNMEGLNNVVTALREIATGKKESTATDKLMEYMMTQQGLMMKAMFDGRGKSDDMDQMTKFLGVLTQTKDLFGGGEDSNVAMAREIGGVVKDSMDKVSDTVVQVTGSAPLKQTAPVERYVCQRCGVQVERTFKLCPNCGLVFKPGIVPPEKPGLMPQAEIFDKPSPPIPEEIKSKLGYLHNLAQFIQQKHDPERKATAFFKALSTEYQKGVLFLASFGYENLMKLAKPWKNSPEIPDRDIVFTLVESTEGEAWIKRFFKSVRNQAQADGVVLTDSEVEMFLSSINEYSPVKFRYHGKPQSEAESENLSQQTLKEDVGTPVEDNAPQTTKKAPPQKERPLEEMTDDELHKKGLSRCFVCQKEGKQTIVASKALKSHLFTNHPRPGKPRADPERVDRPLMDAPPPEPPAPAGNGSDESLEIG